MEQMKHIKILPDSVKRKIAAGEVVEGPFSVVKELVENSIDAGATDVSVEVFDSGLKKIVITDNGSGIFSEVIELTIMEHATSKIEDVHDIDTIGTYGFRGEALSSISSVSNMTILTRHKDQDIGARLDVKDGNYTTGEYAGASGTKIFIENIFFNVPARKKFLKSQRSEQRKIRESIIKMALANHEVTLSLETDGKRQFTFQAVKSLEERVKQVYGPTVASELIFEELNDIKVRISGFLSKPHYMRSSRLMQHIFINGRPVDQKYLGYHLQRAYEAIAQRGKYPAAIIYLEIDPTLVDVNIHPAKREVKLFDQRYIDSLIFHLAEKALNRSHSLASVFEKKINKGDENSENIFSVTSASSDSIEPAENLDTTESEKKDDDESIDEQVQINFRSDQHRETQVYDKVETGDGSQLKEIISEGQRLYSQFNDSRRIIGQLFSTYILLEEKETLYLLDFHAAHERILYDELIEKRVAQDIQELMFPEIIELSTEDYHLVLENIDLFMSMGLEIDDFSDNSITVRTIPHNIGKKAVKDVIELFLENLKTDQAIPDLYHALAASIACHSARRAGDVLSHNEMELLAHKALDEDTEQRCPHGRPFVFILTKDELERMFKRQ
jgi:DNA mismatch repair protein MutL